MTLVKKYQRSNVDMTPQFIRLTYLTIPKQAPDKLGLSCMDSEFTATTNRSEWGYHSGSSGVLERDFFSNEYVRKRIVCQILLNVQSDFQKSVNNPCDNVYEFYVMSD